MVIPLLAGRRYKKYIHQPGIPGRHPLRTAQELADELGLERSVLVRRMNADPAGPRAKLNHKAATVSNFWYSPAEVRAWWLKQQSHGGAT